MHKRFFQLLLCLLAINYCFAQGFDGEIKAFKKQDSVSFPPKHAILFVGSSSFNYWKDVNDYFPGYPIINRGFGGSTLLDVIYYANDIIFPYQPKQIVIYCGENDIAYVDTVNGKTVLNRFKKLFTMIRHKMPGENIVFVSIKPSPSRMKFRKKVEDANRLIKQFISTQKNAFFVDVFHKMMNADNRPMPEIFNSDSLHMNKNGYAIWKKEIQPYLVK